MKKEKNIKRGWTVVISCLLLISVITLLTLVIQSHLVSENVQALTEGWVVQINGREYADVDLDRFHFGILGRGDVLTMTKTLPELTDGKCLILKNQGAWLDLTLGDSEEPAFSFGQESYEKGVMIGSGYMWVDLPRDFSGQQITVTYHILRNMAFSHVWAPRIGNSITIMRDTFESSIVQIWFCLFFLLLGILMIAVALPLCFRYKELLRFLYIGIFCILTGIWVLAYDYAIDIFIQNYELNIYIEYVSLYLLPIPLLLFCREIIINPRKKRVFGIMASVTFGFCMISTFLQFTNLLSFWSTMNFFHILLIVELCVGVFLLLRNANVKTLENQYLMAGSLIVLITALMDLGLYQIQRFMGYEPKLMSIWNTAYGLMVMILCMLVSSVLHLFERIKKENEEILLEKMAYEDFLTGLYNRAKIADIADEIDRTKERDYAVISMDLNSLKYYNDTRGHEYGDQYLVKFSKFLYDYWKTSGIVGRMGGDEFIVILRQITPDAVEMQINDFAKSLTTENEKSLELKMETAYGVAYGEENRDATLRQVYRKADERMYEMKCKMKNARR